MVNICPNFVLQVKLTLFYGEKSMPKQWHSLEVTFWEDFLVSLVFCLRGKTVKKDRFSSQQPAAQRPHFSLCTKACFTLGSLLTQLRTRDQ